MNEGLFYEQGKFMSRDAMYFSACLKHIIFEPIIVKYCLKLDDNSALTFLLFCAFWNSHNYRLRMLVDIPLRTMNLSFLACLIWGF